MKEQAVTHSTFVIERSYPATVQQVFAAFADPAKKRRWFGNDEATEVEEFEIDFRVGGRESRRSRFKADSPFPGQALINQTYYLDIVPDRRIVFAYTMAFGERRFSSSQSTFEFLSDGKGTQLVYTEQAAFFEGADGPKMREEGWQLLLEKLTAELA
jgi:uncharacterized protein YndB with AHSA1/START domain